MSDETTTDRLAEIEGQAEPQPVQMREGRWRTRGGEIRNVTPTPEDDDRVTQYPWYDAEYDQTWASNGRCYLDEESQRDLVQYVGPIEPEPEQTITPDDVAAEALAGVYDETQGLQMQVRFFKDREAMLERKLETTEAALLEQQQRNEQLVTQGCQQRMQIAELRSEVSHVQRLLGESRRRVEELETLVKDLRNINATAEKSAESAARDKADLQHRLDTVAADWALQAETIRGLQIELDAREQVPQAVSDRFEEGWDAGTAQAVESIAEWTEPFRTCGSQSLALAVLQNLPHIMRSLTGLAEED